MLRCVALAFRASLELKEVANLDFHFHHSNGEGVSRSKFTIMQQYRHTLILV